MLVTQQDLEVGKIYTFKITTGEEVVAKVAEVMISHIKLNSPMQLTANAQGVGLAPAFFTLTDGKDATLYKSAIIAHFIPDAQFITAYESAVTGIELPSNQIVT